jgi:Protein of unknown function (DUF1326)
MKKLASILAGLLSAGALLAAEAPRGNLLELHSCALYAGGCVVSSQSTLGGRYMLRAWQFTAGSYAGTDLAGLQLALLQASSENLAEPGSDSGEAVVYLPQSASATQREALLSWLKSTVPDLNHRQFAQRVLSLRFSETQSGWAFAAGDTVAMEVTAPEHCETGACGESLWYEPQSATTLYTVALNRSAQISEPLLKLRWSDAGKRSVFVARFDGASTMPPQYAGDGRLCGVGSRLLAKVAQ